MNKGLNILLLCFFYSFIVSFSLQKSEAEYASDWRKFKGAVEGKDRETVKTFCTENITDFKKLVQVLNVPHARRALDETPFDKLEQWKSYKKNALRFYAEDVGIDKFGYEYKISVSLFFLKTENGLRLDDYKFVE